MWGTTNTKCWSSRFHVHITFLEYIVCFLYLYICNLHLIFIYEVVTYSVTNKLHVVRTETFRTIHKLLTFFFQFLCDESSFLRRKIRHSIIINFKLAFSISKFWCCMWSVCSSRKKITIYSHRVCSLYRPKSLSTTILIVQNIIISEEGFKIMYFLHRNCNTNHIKI